MRNVVLVDSNGSFTFLKEVVDSDGRSCRRTCSLLLVFRLPVPRLHHVVPLSLYD